MLADLCFSDLVLYEVSDDPDVLAITSHMRPTTAQTIYPVELVGQTRTRDQRPLVAQCFDTGELVHGEIESTWLGERVHVWCIPVVDEGRTIAVLARETAAAAREHPGELEQRYIQIFDRFAHMISRGYFPYERERVIFASPARVGDGVVIFDGKGRVEFASPNANSALSRAGFRGPFVGMRFDEFGVDHDAAMRLVRRAEPMVAEYVGPNEVTISVYGFPLIGSHGVDAGLVLMRDITDLRRRDKLLLSKDATIQEIHHRVKNNLQTVSSLLRLQARRAEAPEAKAAISDSVRRIQSIALVHEMLSLETSDNVSLLSMLRPLVRAVQESLSSTEHPVEFRITGDAGDVGSKVVTVLSMVVTELVQNCVTHGFGVADAGAPLATNDPVVEVHLERSSELIGHAGREVGSILVEVRDNGRGFANLTDGAPAKNLGLSIVHSLVEGELCGTVSYSDRSADSAGTGHLSGVNHAALAGGGGAVVSIIVPTEAFGIAQISEVS